MSFLIKRYRHTTFYWVSQILHLKKKTNWRSVTFLYELSPYRKVNLINKCCVFLTVLLIGHSICRCLVGPPYSLTHSNIEIKPINNSTKASDYPIERKIVCLTLHKKLKIITSKLNEEGMSKANAAWKLGLVCQLAKLWTQRKSFEGNYKWTHKW